MKLLIIATDLIRLTLAAVLLVTCWWLSWLAIEPTVYALAIASGVYGLILIHQTFAESKKAATA